MKAMYFLKQEDVFSLNDLKSFHAYIIPPVRMLLTVYLVFFGYKFPGKASKKVPRSKNLYTQSFTAVSMFKIHVPDKKKEQSNKPVQSLHS